MTLLYASTFTDALARLSNQEQKQVKLTAFDLQLDPTSKGLQMHRIDKAEGFWSIRVNLELRIILHKEGERILLYVACTRARDRLLVSGVEPGSEFLDDLET